MDNQRIIIIALLGFVALLLYQAWQQDYATPTATQTRGAPPAGSASSPTGSVDQTTPSTPAAQQPASAEVPSVPSAPTAQAVVRPADHNVLQSDGRIRVRTDVYEILIDKRGGDLRSVKLLKFDQSNEDPEPFLLMTDAGAQLHVAQSGFTEAGLTHQARFEAPQNEYVLEAGAQQLEVPLSTTHEGVTYTKTYIFKPGQYSINVRHALNNQSQQAWKGAHYVQLQRSHFGDDRSPWFGMYTYMGAAWYTPEEKFEKVDFEDIQAERPSLASVTAGWIAMLQHYFVGAWIPDAQIPHRFETAYVPASGNYIVRSVGVLNELAPGEQLEIDSKLYVGPKRQERLDDIAPGLALTVDYGIFTILAKPLFWLLKWFYELVGNWGWAIVLLTITIKLVFYKLSETSYKSMAHMRKVQPRMQALKERYGDDKQKLNQAMMQLYREEKINPLGGCLPILVQIPVFIALYWVLLESVELRHAPWMLWIQDLSSKDPYFVLPILMGVSMFLQQRLNPAPIDPVQQKVFMAMPIVFTAFFLFFPAGLVLYWLVNNVLSIAQQWVITRRIAGPSS